MKTKLKTIGGREYRVLGSTTESERGMVVFQSFTVGNGKVVIENGKVTHPDGTITDIAGKILETNVRVVAPPPLESDFGATGRLMGG